MSFDAAIAAAVKGSPMVNGYQEKVPGRMLLIDGDALAYSCAGRDDTLEGQARVNMYNFIDKAITQAGAESCRLLVTAPGSRKGFRYLVATVKPYQGQRVNNRRPKNWAFLRQLLETNTHGAAPTILESKCEADDLFSRFSRQLGAENVWLLTEDKDMRMVPGTHMDWKTFRTTWVPEGTWSHTFNDKLFGRKWFWMQMLHGDTADNIPGLPQYVKPTGKFGLMGPATAAKMLDGVEDEPQARAVVFGLYRDYYAGDPTPWQVHVLEQAILLWMRNDALGSVLNVADAGNPLDGAMLGWAEHVSSVYSRIGKSL